MNSPWLKVTAGSLLLVVAGRSAGREPELPPLPPPPLTVAMVEAPGAELFSGEGAGAARGAPEPLSPAVYLPEVGERVVDELGVLGAPEEGKIRELLAEGDRAGVRLQVMVLRETPPVPAEEYFGALHERAGGGWIHGVIFHARGVTEGPVVRLHGPGVRELGADRLRQVALAAQEAAGAASGGGILRCLEGLVRGIQGLREESAVQPGPLDLTARPLVEKKNLRKADRAGLLVGGPLVALALGGGLWLGCRRRPQALIFPDVQTRPRLGAPYSGGNNAAIDFRGRRRAAGPC